MLPIGDGLQNLESVPGILPANHNEKGREETMNTFAKYLCVLLLSGVACAANALVMHHPGYGFTPAFQGVKVNWPGVLKPGGAQGLPLDFSLFSGAHHGGANPLIPPLRLVPGPHFGSRWIPPVYHGQPEVENDPPAAVWEPSAGLLMVVGFAMLILVRLRQARLSRLQDSVA